MIVGVILPEVETSINIRVYGDLSRTAFYRINITAYTPSFINLDST